MAEVLVRGAAVTRGEGVGEALGADTVDGGREAAVWKGWQSEVKARESSWWQCKLEAAVVVLGEAAEWGLVVNGWEGKGTYAGLDGL